MYGCSSSLTKQVITSSSNEVSKKSLSRKFLLLHKPEGTLFVILINGRHKILFSTVNTRNYVNWIDNICKET